MNTNFLLSVLVDMDVATHRLTHWPAEATATPTTTNGEIHARYKTTATDLYSRRSRSQRTGRGPRADPRQLGVLWRRCNQYTAIDCRDDPKHRPRTDPRRRAGPHAV